MARVKVEIELLSDGLAKLMQSAGVVGVVNDAAGRIAGLAGPEFEAKPAQVVGDRALALVVPTDKEGMIAEARDKTLTKAVSACRL